MIHFLLRIRKELYERISLLAKQENISRNKMMLKLLELGLLTYLEGGMKKYENELK